MSLHVLRSKAFSTCTVRRPSSFSRIRLDHAFLPGPPHRFCLLVVPISRFVAVFQLPPVAPPRQSSSAANFNNRNTARRSSILAQSLSQVKGSNYSITQLATARATILPFPSTPQHIVCAQLLPSYLLHLLIFLLSIEQVANHEAPVCIGGHRSRGGPVSQC